MTIIGAICFILAAGLGFQWWYHHVGPGYFKEFNAIREELEKIPNIEVLEMNYYEDKDIPFLPEVCRISANVRIHGKGEMLFHYLTKESFEETQSLNIVSVNGHAFRYRGKGYKGVYKAATGEKVRSEFAGGSILVGKQGDFANLFPFEISNVQTAIEKFDDIAKVIESWPETPEPPAAFTAADGSDYFYWVAPKGTYESDSAWQSDTNWHMPYSKLQAQIEDPN